MRNCAGNLQSSRSNKTQLTQNQTLTSLNMEQISSEADCRVGQSLQATRDGVVTIHRDVGKSTTGDRTVMLR